MIFHFVSVGSGSGCRQVFDPRPISYLEQHSYHYQYVVEILLSK